MDKKKIYDFLKEARYIILFYIIGDILTTWIALDYYGAHEGNPLPAWLHSQFGMFPLVLLKLFALSLIYWLYNHSREQNYINVWNSFRTIIVYISLYVVCSNSFQILLLAGII
jgi:uncharacterized membrane protein